MFDLIACHANDDCGVGLFQHMDGYWVVETCSVDGTCYAYKKVYNLQEAWAEFDAQKKEHCL